MTARPIPVLEIATDAMAKGRNSPQLNIFAITKASSGLSRFANLLFQGVPRSPIKIEGIARIMSGKVIDHGDSCKTPEW